MVTAALEALAVFAVLAEPGVMTGTAESGAMRAYETDSGFAYGAGKGNSAWYPAWEVA